MSLHHGDLHCQVPILRATMLESSVKTPKTILLLLIASKWITWIHQASQVDTLAIIQWMNNLIPVVINATCKPPEIHTCITYTSGPYYSQYSLQKQVKRRTGILPRDVTTPKQTITVGCFRTDNDNTTGNKRHGTITDGWSHELVVKSPRTASDSLFSTKKLSFSYEIG